MLSADFPGLLLFFLLGWGLGWLTLGNWRLALFPAFATVLIARFGHLQDWLGNPSDPLVFVVPIVVLTFFLWSMTRLPLPVVGRVLFVSVLVPLLVMSLAFGVVLFLLKQFP